MEAGVRRQQSQHSRSGSDRGYQGAQFPRAALAPAHGFYPRAVAYVTVKAQTQQLRPVPAGQQGAAPVLAARQPCARARLRSRAHLALGLRAAGPPARPP